MGSRFKQEPDKIFEVFIEFVREKNGKEEQGRVVRFYPKDFDDEEILKPSLKFAFPYSIGSNRLDDQYFTFVMTDINSKFKFGFCRLQCRGDVERNYCFVSCLPWFEPFYSLLGEISTRLTRQDEEGASMMLSQLHQSNPRGSSQIIALSPSPNESFNFVCPIIPSLPSIPQNKNFTELFRSFRTSNLMVLFSSMLFERRILMHGSSIERLTACIQGLNQLIYPMCWQHLFIPVLPPLLLDYCSAPMPYVIGLHSFTMTKLNKIEYSDAVLVNLDENKIYTEHADLAAIPHDVLSTLKKQLKLQKALMEKGSPIGDGVSKAFLAAMVSLIGGYRNAMRFHDGADITFDPDIFVAGASFSKDPSCRPEYKRFFELVLHMQSFQQFINDRLDIMNAGKGFQDAFDRAVTSMSGDEDRWKTQSRYKDWLSHMKKQGKILRREGKDKWTVFASKVRSKSKKTWKDMKSRLDENKKDEISSNMKPSKQFSSQYKPPRPPPPGTQLDLRTTALLKSGMLRRNSLERTQRYNLLDVDILDSKSSSINNDSNDTLNRVDTNLTNDPDLLSWMMRSSRYEALTDHSWMKKSYSVEGLFNGKGNEDPISQSALDTSMSSTGKDSLINARNYSSTNMMAKRLENFDASSLDSSSNDVPGREGLNIKRNEPLDNHMSTSLSYNFRETPTSNLDNQKPQNYSQLNFMNHQDWSNEDLMDFGSSGSSIEFDPLKQKTAEVTFIDQKPTPMPRIKRNNLNFTNSNANPNEENKNRSQPVLPQPLPRRRDAASIQYYHHRKHTLKNDPQTKLSKGDKRDPDNVVRNDFPNSSIEAATSHLLDGEKQSLATTTKLARSLFLQSDCNIPLSNSGLETFDPLASGQLVIDCPNSVSTATNHQKSDDELLKDWDLLDITKGVANASFKAAPNAHQIDSQPPVIRHSGFYATQFAPSFPQQTAFVQPTSPLVIANNIPYKAFNIQIRQAYPIVVQRNQKASTLPVWTNYNKVQDNQNKASNNQINRPGASWETFE